MLSPSVSSNVSCHSVLSDCPLKPNCCLIITPTLGIVSHTHPHFSHFKVPVKSKIICRDLIHNDHINRAFPVAHSVAEWIREGPACCQPFQSYTVGLGGPHLPPGVNPQWPSKSLKVSPVLKCEIERLKLTWRGQSLELLAINEDWQCELYTQHGGVCDDEPQTDLVEYSLHENTDGHAALCPQSLQKNPKKTLQLQPTGFLKVCGKVFAWNGATPAN